MNKSVRRVTLVQLSDNGNTAATIFKRRSKRRKSSKALDMQERMTRRMLEANEIFGDEMLRKHKKSARDRKDGWMGDSSANSAKAARKAFKHLVRI